MNKNENNEINLTIIFWNYFKISDFQQIEKYLSSNIQIRTSFHENPIRIGILLSLDYLKELSSKLRQPTLKLDLNNLQHLILMKNEKQTRFIISNKNYSNSNLNYGFALNWSYGIIIEIVIIKNVTASLFFIENTSSNYSTSLNTNNSLSSSPLSSILISTPPSSPNLHETENRLSLSNYNMILNPPYLVPRPPIVPATITITVMECRSLKSRLIRLIERSVCSYVVVEFCGIKRRTETIKYNNFPSYNIHTNFIFEFNEQQRNSSVYFTVMDEHFINDDVLAQTEVPIESLPNRLDTSTPLDITLPLILEGNIFEDSTERNRIDDLPPALIVRISKVDAQEWWVNEEMKARAEAEARRIERLEELEREVQLKFTAEKANPKSKRLSETSLSMVRLTEVNENPQPAITPQTNDGNNTNEISKTHWVDSSQVLMCME